MRGIVLTLIALGAISLSTTAQAAVFCPAPVSQAAATLTPKPVATPRPVPVAFKPVTGGSVEPPLVFLGDSLTAGTGAKDAANRYPERTASLLGDRSFTILAEGGQGSSLLASLFAKESLAAQAVVLIWVGRNNYRDVDQVVDDVNHIVDHIGDRRFLVLSVLGGRSATEAGAQQTDKLFGAVNSSLAQVYPDNFVPVGNGLSCDDYADNTHLKDSGYLKIADQVAEVLQTHNW